MHLAPRKPGRRLRQTEYDEVADPARLYRDSGTLGRPEPAIISRVLVGRPPPATARRPGNALAADLKN